MMMYLSVPPVSPVGIEVIDPQITRAAIFRPGLAMIVREATVSPGTHTFRLKRIPEAMDNSLWFDSQDGATISDVLTHFKVDTSESTVKASTIRDYIENNTGRQVAFDVRDYTGRNGPTHVSGLLIRYVPDGSSGTAVLKSNESLSEYPVASIAKLQLAGLKEDYQEKIQAPLVDVVFKVKTDRLSHIRISSLEGGAAWNASYLVELGAGDASVTSKAQVALGGLRLKDTDIDLVAGMPDFNRSTRLDLATGLSSLNDWLDQRPGALVALPREDDDPYVQLARQINQGFNGQFGVGGLGGGGFGGGAGGGGVYSANANSLGMDRRATEEDRVKFIERAIQAARLEDTFVYPFGHIDLEPGERLTRNLSKTQSPVKNRYVWSVSLLPGSGPDTVVRRILSLKNNSTAPWPGGSIFLTRNNIPLAEVQMPFTAAGSYADIEMGKAEDISKAYTVNEISRTPIQGNWRYSIKIEYEATLHIQNTRLETLPLDIDFDVLGDVHSGDEGQIVKLGNLSNWENSNTSVRWHFDLEPNEKKELHVKYAVNT